MLGTILVNQVESLEGTYSKILDSIGDKKGIKVGGVIVTFPNKEKTICEVSSTFITKPGRFSKEQRVIVTLIFNKVDDGAYSAKVDDSIFHIVTEEKGGLKESWSGNLEEARERIQDVTELYLEAVNSLNDKYAS